MLYERENCHLSCSHVVLPILLVQKQGCREKINRYPPIRTTLTSQLLLVHAQSRRLAGGRVTLPLLVLKIVKGPVATIKRRFFPPIAQFDREG